MWAKRHVLPFVLLIIFLCSASSFVTPILRSLVVSARAWGESGTIDFLAYWSAFRVWDGGGNPYDPQLLLQVQREFHQRSSPIMVWNPPWTLLMLRPLLEMDFFGASRFWGVINLLFILTSGVLIWTTDPNLTKNKTWTEIPRGEKSLRVLNFCAVLLCFYPIWNTIYFGQLSIILVLSLSIFVWAITRKYDFGAGASLALLSIKPHLFLLFGAVLTWWIIRERRYRVVLGFLISFVSLLTLTAIFFPNTFSWWQETLSGRKLNGAIPMSDWVGTTAGGILRGIPGLDTPLLILAPLVVVTAVTLSFLIRRNVNLNWSQHLGPVIILSYFFSPWGWVYDQVILLVSFLFLMCQTRTVANKSEQMFTIIFGSELLIFLVATNLMTAQHHGFWIPPFILFIWWVGKNILQPD